MTKKEILKARNLRAEDSLWDDLQEIADYTNEGNRSVLIRKILKDFVKSVKGDVK
jgi:predicted transcriptional regulator